MVCTDRLVSFGAINPIAVVQTFLILGLQNIFQPLNFLFPGINGREVTVAVPWGEIRLCIFAKSIYTACEIR